MGYYCSDYKIIDNGVSNMMKIYSETKYEPNNNNINLLISLYSLINLINKLMIDLPVFAKHIKNKKKRNDIFQKCDWLKEWHNDFLTKLFDELKIKSILAKNISDTLGIIQGYTALINLTLNEDIDVFSKCDEIFETIRNMPYNLTEQFEKLELRTFQETEKIEVKQMSYYSDLQYKGVLAA